MFLELVDKVIKQMSIVDVAKKLKTVMASDIHQIPLFASEFISKLINCVSPFIFKVYVLPYMSWFDYHFLKQLVNFSSNNETLKMLGNFIDSLDYSRPISSYDIPEFSQLVIPLENRHYTILATKHIKSISTLTLQDLMVIKTILIKKLEITEYAIQLAATHNEFCCFYWLIPKQIQPLIENALSKPQLELWDKGIVFTTLLRVNSEGSIVQHSIHDIFNISYVDSENLIEVRAMCFVFTLYMHVRILYDIFVHCHMHTYVSINVDTYMHDNLKF